MASRNSALFLATITLTVAAMPTSAFTPDPVFVDAFEPLAANFRFDTLSLRDPHVFVSFFGCQDLTDSQAGSFSVNGQLQTRMQTDADSDGLLDMSYVQRLRPLDQSSGAIAEADFFTANCLAPFPSSACFADGSLPLMSVATSQSSGTCLAAIAGTTQHAYLPAITSSSAPCFSTSAASVTLNLAGISVTLQDAQVAATYAGNPVTGLSNGLLTGFLSEADANNVILPASFPLAAGQPLSALLAGGTGACPAYSDKEMINGVVGWQFYLNFTATKIKYVE